MPDFTLSGPLHFSKAYVVSIVVPRFVVTHLDWRASRQARWYVLTFIRFTNDVIIHSDAGRNP